MDTTAPEEQLVHETYCTNSTPKANDKARTSAILLYAKTLSIFHKYLLSTAVVQKLKITGTTMPTSQQWRSCSLN